MQERRRKIDLSEGSFIFFDETIISIKSIILLYGKVLREVIQTESMTSLTIFISVLLLSEERDMLSLFNFSSGQSLTCFPVYALRHETSAFQSISVFHSL